VRRQLSLALLLQLACGRSTHGADEPGSPVGGETSSEEVGASALPNAGQQQAGASATSGGEVGLGGGAPDGAGSPLPSSAGAPEVEPLRAGTRYCESAEDCLGLDCIGFASTAARICSSSCEDNAGCALGELCIGAGALASLCLQPCQSAEDCAYGFDCVHYQDIATFCLPAPWTERFMHPTP
jgi:hypothetical protein